MDEDDARGVIAFHDMPLCGLSRSCDLRVTQTAPPAHLHASINPQVLQISNTSSPIRTEFPPFGPSPIDNIPSSTGPSAKACIRARFHSSRPDTNHCGPSLFSFLAPPSLPWWCTPVLFLVWAGGPPSPFSSTEPPEVPNLSPYMADQDVCCPSAPRCPESLINHGPRSIVPLTMSLSKAIRLATRKQSPNEEARKKDRQLPHSCHITAIETSVLLRHSRYGLIPALSMAAAQGIQDDDLREELADDVVVCGDIAKEAEVDTLYFDREGLQTKQSDIEEWTGRLNAIMLLKGDFATMVMIGELWRD